MIPRISPLLAGFLVATALGPDGAPAQEPAAALAGTPRTEVLTAGAMDPAISPDGERIAISILGKLWLLPIAGGDAVQITNGVGWDARPAWSPDGQFIAYAHSLPTSTALMELNLATGAARVVREVEGSLGPIAYGPDGGDLFYVLLRGQYDAHLWRQPRAGGDARQLTHTRNWHEWSFALSPRADTVFLESGQYGGADLYLLVLDSLRATRLTDTPRLNEFVVAWTGDGRTRLWVVGQNGVDTVMAQTGGAPPRALHASAYGQKQLAADPAGRFAVLADARRLYRIDLANGGATPSPFAPRSPSPPAPPATSPSPARACGRAWTAAG